VSCLRLSRVSLSRAAPPLPLFLSEEEAGAPGADGSRGGTRAPHPCLRASHTPLNYRRARLTPCRLWAACIPTRFGGLGTLCKTHGSRRCRVAAPSRADHDLALTNGPRISSPGAELDAAAPCGVPQRRGANGPPAGSRDGGPQRAHAGASARWLGFSSADGPCSPLGRADGARMGADETMRVDCASCTHGGANAPSLQRSTVYSLALRRPPLQGEYRAGGHVSTRPVGLFHPWAPPAEHRKASPPVYYY